MYHGFHKNIKQHNCCIYIYSTRENNSEFIKMTHSEVYLCLILNTVLLPGWFIFIFFVIVVHESLFVLNSWKCEKMDIKSIHSLLERVQIREKCWKTKRKNQVWIIQVTIQYKESSLCKLLNRVIFINSTIVFSCGLSKLVFLKYLLQVSTK